MMSLASPRHPGMESKYSMVHDSASERADDAHVQLNVQWQARVQPIYSVQMS